MKGLKRIHLGKHKRLARAAPRQVGRRDSIRLQFKKRQKTPETKYSFCTSWGIKTPKARYRFCTTWGINRHCQLRPPQNLHSQELGWWLSCLGVLLHSPLMIHFWPLSQTTCWAQQTFCSPYYPILHALCNICSCEIIISPALKWNALRTRYLQIMHNLSHFFNLIKWNVRIEWNAERLHFLSPHFIRFAARFLPPPFHFSTLHKAILDTCFHPVKPLEESISSPRQGVMDSYVHLAISTQQFN